MDFVDGTYTLKVNFDFGNEPCGGANENRREFDGERGKKREKEKEKERERRREREEEKEKSGI